MCDLIPLGPPIAATAWNPRPLTTGRERLYTRYEGIVTDAEVLRCVTSMVGPDMRALVAAACLCMIEGAEGLRGVIGRVQADVYNEPWSDNSR